MNSALAALQYVMRMLVAALRDRGLTVTIFSGVRSLWGNQIGARGAEALGEALQVNSALSALQYVPCAGWVPGSALFRRKRGR